MRPLLIECLLAAHQSRLDDLSRTFHGKGPAWGAWELGLALLALLVIAAVIWGVGWLRDFLEGRSRWNAPLAVFVGLCRAHRLSWRQSLLLWRLAKGHGLDAPGRVFLEPERFDPGQLSPAMLRSTEMLEDLKAQLFHGLDESPPVPKDIGQMLEPNLASVSLPEVSSRVFGLPLGELDSVSGTSDPATPIAS